MTDVMEALKGVEEKHGVTFSHKNVTYSDREFWTKLVALEVKDPRDQKSINHASFMAKVSQVRGITKQDFNRVFKVQGKEFRIVDLAPKSWKYPVIAQGPDGKRYKFTVAATYNQ